MSRLVGGAVALVLVLFAVVTGVRSAAACIEPDDDGVVVRTFYPEDGSRNVPVNARIVVEWQDATNLMAPWGVDLVDDAGTPVSIEISRLDPYGRYYELRPMGDLRANTVYTLLLPDAQCSQTPLECERQPSFAMSFETGDVVDQNAPAIENVLAAREPQSDYCLGDDCTCDSEWALLQQGVVIGEAADEEAGSDLRYMAYRDGELIGRFRMGGSLTLLFICGGTPVWWASSGTTAWEPGASYTLRAVDMAGHESAMSTAFVAGEPDCSGFDSFFPDADAGPPVSAWEHESTQGCSVSRSPGRSFVLILLAFVATSARRRRRAR